MSKRAFGITATSLLLGWLAIAAIGNALILFNGEGEPIFPRWMGVLALAYAVTAAAASIGIWMQKSWSIQALRAWIIVLIAFFVVLSVFIPKEIILGGYLSLLAFFIIFGAIIYMLERYVRHHLSG